MLVNSRRLQHSSTARPAGETGLAICHIQEPDGRVERRRAQVHVALRRGQVLVSGQFLNGPRRRPTHRQVRTERVPQDVHPALRYSGPPRRSSHQLTHDLMGERHAVMRT